MPAHCRCDRKSNRHHATLPFDTVGDSRWETDLRRDGIDDQCLKPFAILDVVVQRHRTRSQLGGNASHRERAKPVSVHNP